MEALFKLIKSLDKGEKRYFSLYASRHLIKGTSYDVELFHAIDKCTVLNDNEVKKKLTSAALKNNYSIHKHLLYKSILRSLTTYHTGKDAEDEIIELFKTSKILYEKGLYEESKKNIEKAKKIAIEHECFSLFIMLCEKENIIHERHFVMDEFKSKIIDDVPYLHNVLRKLENKLAYAEIKNTLLHHIKVWGILDEQINKKYLPDLPYDYLQNDEKNAESDIAKINFWKIKSNLNYRNKEYENSIQYNENILKTIHLKPDNYPYKTEEILGTLDRMIWNYLMLGNGKKLAAILKQVEKLPDENRNIKLLKFQLFTNYDLLHRINTGKIEDAEDVEEKILQFYNEFDYAISIQLKLIFNYNLATLFFSAGKFHKALHWYETLSSNNIKNIDADIVMSARLVIIIIQYELKMHSLVRYSVLSAKRFLKKKRDLNEFDILFFNTINKLSDYSEDEKIIFQNFITQIRMFLDSGKPVDKCFPYYQWAKAKLENKPLNLVIKTDNSTYFN